MTSPYWIGLGDSVQVLLRLSVRAERLPPLEVLVHRRKEEDGALWSSSPGPDSASPLDFLSARDIEAIEIYRGPAQVPGLSAEAPRDAGSSRSGRAGEVSTDMVTMVNRCHAAVARAWAGR